MGDVDEIAIKRRVKETEDNYYSYYYLNGRSCNLSDIQDLLAQAGITPEGYNVVMQGDVTEIINMTAGSRRGSSTRSPASHSSTQRRPTPSTNWRSCKNASTRPSSASRRNRSVSINSKTNARRR